METESLKGQLLVANPSLPDPNFDRTVILVLAHEDDGALGLVLNRPSEMDIDSPLPRWERLAAEPPVVFVGGPVAPGAAICLARVPAEEAATVSDGARRDNGWIPLVGELGTLDLERDPDELGVPVEAIRVFAGYAGWGPGQLAGEIEAGAWFVVPAQPGDAMSSDPAQLWKAVLRRQGGELAMVSAFPRHPGLN
jgi:putative transcriptional regulator